VAQVAAAFGVSWATVMAAVRVHGRPRVDDPARTDGVGALGVDETAFLAGNAQHPTTYVTGIVDVRAPRLLDVVAGRSAKALSDWVCARPQDWREGIDVAALDPFRG
jgi:transposase